MPNTNKLKNLIVFLIIFFGVLFFAKASWAAEDIYIAQTSSGGDTGANCSNAHSMAWLNTSGNWGSGAGQISPGDTVHFCGTISSSFQVKGSGTSGSPTTFFWEPNAKFSAPTWTTTNPDGRRYIIDINYKSYLIFDGGTNGVIEATDNGTNKTYKNDFTAFLNRLSGGIGNTDVTIKNLTVRNLYVREGSTDTVIAGMGLQINDCSNLIVQNCIFINMYAYIWNAADAYTTTNHQYLNNQFTKARGGRLVSYASHDFDGILIDGNQFDDLMTWYQVNNVFHCEYWQIFAFNNYIKNITIRNNTFGLLTGVGMGYYSTAFIYPTGRWDNLLIYNNIFYTPDGTQGGTDATLALYPDSTATSIARVYNNIFRGPNNTFGRAISVGQQAGSTLTTHIYNNIFLDYGAATYVMGGGTTSYHDYNLFYDITGQSFAQIKAFAQGGDTNSSYGVNPSFVGATDFHLTAGSWAIDHGVSEATYFTVDKVGTIRPQGSAWDIGAYEYSSGGPIDTTAPAAPTGVRVQ